MSDQEAILRDWDTPPPAEGPLTWEEVKRGMRQVPVVWGSHHTQHKQAWVRLNADRIGPVPVSAIMKGTSKWETEHIDAVLVLESLGKVVIEHDDAYVRAMSRSCPPDLDAVGGLPVPDFFDLVLRMIALAPKDVAPWAWFLQDWVADGHLPRDTAMRTLLSALSAGVGNTLSRVYLESYERCAPTMDDLVRDQDILRRMLVATEVATLKFAVVSAKALYDAGRLEVSRFLAAAPDTSVTSAVNVRLILSMASRAAQDDPRLLDEARRLHEAALGHSNGDIRAIALSWTSAHGGGPLVEMTPPADAPRQERTWQTYEAWPRSEIVERTVALFGSTGDPLEIEAGLAAWASMDEATRAELAKVTVRDNSYRLAPYMADAVVRRCRYLGAEGYSPELSRPSCYPYAQPLVYDRLLEVLQTIGRPAPRVLLATPATAAGWVRASALVERMLANDAAGLPPLHFDLTAALLRLDPRDPDRAAALRTAQQGSSEAWAAIAYALGGGPAEVVTPSWWVAAARSRSLEADQLLLNAGLTLPGQGPPLDVSLEVSRWRDYFPGEQRQAKKLLRVTVHSAAGEVAVSAGPWRKDAPEWILDQPTVLRSAYWDQHGRDHISPHVVGWSATMWLASVEHAASLGVLVLAGASVDEPDDLSAEVVRAIADSPGQIGALGLGCVAFALSNPDKLVRAQAAELFAYEAGYRVDVLALADTMAAVADACTVARWADALRDAARISLSAGQQAVSLLTCLLPQLDHARTGVFALIEVLDEQLRMLKQAPGDAELLSWLRGFAGSSKAAKLAKQVIMLAG